MVAAVLDRVKRVADEAQRNGSTLNRWAIGILITVNLLAWPSIWSVLVNHSNRLVSIEATHYTPQMRAEDLLAVTSQLAVMNKHISKEMVTKEDLEAILASRQWLIDLVRQNEARIREIERKR